MENFAVAVCKMAQLWQWQKQHDDEEEEEEAVMGKSTLFFTLPLSWLLAC